MVRMPRYPGTTGWKKMSMRAIPHAPIDPIYPVDLHIVEAAGPEQREGVSFCGRRVEVVNAYWERAFGQCPTCVAEAHARDLA